MERNKTRDGRTSAMLDRIAAEVYEKAYDFR